MCVIYGIPCSLQLFRICLTLRYSRSIKMCYFYYRNHYLHFWLSSPARALAFSYHEVSWSHTTTRHSREDSSGRVISSSQRPLPDNTHNRHPCATSSSKPCIKLTLHCNHRSGHLKTEHTGSLFLLRRHLGNWSRGPAVRMRSKLLVVHKKLGQLPLLTVYVLPV
jgi:hypothetical protein